MYAADVALVRERGRQEFQDDRVAEPIGGRDRPLLVLGDLRRDGRDAVQGEQLLRFGLGQEGGCLRDPDERQW